MTFPQHSFAESTFHTSTQMPHGQHLVLSSVCDLCTPEEMLTCPAVGIAPISYISLVRILIHCDLYLTNQKKSKIGTSSRSTLICSLLVYNPHIQANKSTVKLISETNLCSPVVCSSKEMYTLPFNGSVLICALRFPSIFTWMPRVRTKQLYFLRINEYFYTWPMEGTALNPVIRYLSLLVRSQ